MTQIRQIALLVALGMAPALSTPAAAQEPDRTQRPDLQKPVSTQPAEVQEPDPTLGPPPAERFYVNLSGGFQAKSETIREAGSFDIYDEPAQFTLGREIEGGGLFDIGGGVRFMRRFGAGLSYTQRVKTTDDITADVTVPHPLFGPEPRSASVQVGGVGYSERAVHLQAAYFLPLTTRIDIAFFVGPSFFTVDLDRASIGPENVQEGPFPFTTVSLSGATISGRSESAVGFNIGVDGTYLVTRRFGGHFGGGLFLRYSRASVDIPAVAGGGSVGVDAGGFEVGGGLRVRF
jgi:hypothetical protein